MTVLGHCHCAHRQECWALREAVGAQLSAGRRVASMRLGAAGGAATASLW